MHVLLISKACIVGQYQTKLEAIAQQPGVRLTVVVPPSWKDERGLVPLERAHTEGYTLIVEPIALNGHFHLHYYPGLPGIIESSKPDIIHLDEEPYNFATFHAFRAIERIGSHSLFFTWQNIDRRYPPPFSWMEARVLQKADGAIAGNQEAAQILAAKGFRHPVHVIPQFGVDPDAFIPRNSQSHGNSRLRIGYVGRFVPEKGLDLLLESIAQVPGNWCLHLLGDGPFRANMERLAHDLGIYERMQIDPWRPSAQMPEFFRSLDVLVLPSRTLSNWKEQFGRVLIEAMACQVPVIGSSCGEIPNVVGDAGLIFREGSKEELKSAVERVLSDDSLRLTMGEKGRRRVLARYTQAQVALESVKVYHQILGV